ncbi:uncharacterized protein [Ptychodera flava]|uniref:uncharacterized protein n=1 Tax=Ptychodera flava TaxID=63121 RepID=UPI00396A0E5E
MLRNIMGLLFLLLIIDFKITCEFRGNHTDSNVVADYSKSQCSFEVVVPENTPVGEIIFTLPHCQSNETTNETSRKPMPTETSTPTRLTFKNVSIMDGNKNERFKVASDTGDISVAGYLDSNIDGKYILTILIETVQNTSQSLCTVTIILEEVDGWPPYYNETCEMPTRGLRKVEIPTFIAFFYGHSKVPLEVVIPHFYEGKFKGDINNDQCKLTMYFPVHVWYSSLNLDLRGSDYELKALGVGDLEVAFSLYHEKAQFPSDSLYDEEWFNPIHVTHSGPYALLKTVFNNINTKLLSVPIKWTLQVRKQQVSSGEGWIDYIGCPDGKYGFRCNKPCICKNDARCNVFNGACKCKSGWQGPACDIPTSCIEIHPKQQQLVYGSLLILTCTTHNIILPSENDEWKSRISWSLNGEYLNHHTLNFTKDGFNVEERMLGISILQTERGVTEKTAGHYKCEATDEYNNLFVATATVTTKCPENVFGQYCNISCDCAPAWSASCHRYRGCVCYPGFSGKPL